MAELNLNLSCVEPELIDLAKKAWAENDIMKVTGYMPNTRRLSFLIDNYWAFKQHDLYEEALLDAYIGTRTNFSRWSVYLINYLFEKADRQKLLECGDPLPGDGPYIIYRGVSGRGAARRIRGISWTGSLERAIWFAKRFYFEKPAVFEATVEKVLVYAYSNERNEAEFLCKIPSDLKLKKVWQGQVKGGDQDGDRELNYTDSIIEGGNAETKSSSKA